MKMDVLIENMEKYLGKSDLYHYILSVIRQKGEAQNGCFKKTKRVRFSEKRNLSYPLIRTHTWFAAFRYHEVFSITRKLLKICFHGSFHEINFLESVNHKLQKNKKQNKWNKINNNNNNKNNNKNKKNE